MKIKIIATFILRDIPIHFINIITSLLPNHLYINRLRGKLISPFLGGAGAKLQIGRGVIINNPANLFLGDDCYLSHYCYIQAKGTIDIGDNVIIGPMNIVASSKHIFKEGIFLHQGDSKPIVIESGTLTGGNVTILSGIKIGQGAKIGAGSVVTKDVDSESFVAGVPAKIVSEN